MWLSGSRFSPSIHRFTSLFSTLKYLSTQTLNNLHTGTLAYWVLITYECAYKFCIICVLLFYMQEMELYLSPRLNQLKSLWSHNNRVDIIRTVSPWWKKVALHLKFEDSALALIQANVGHMGAQTCCQHMFRHWLEGSGGQPASWATLLEALQDSGFYTLAEKIMDALTPQPSFQCECSCTLFYHG